MLLKNDDTYHATAPQPRIEPIIVSPIPYNYILIYLEIPSDPRSIQQQRVVSRTFRATATSGTWNIDQTQGVHDKTLIEEQNTLSRQEAT